MGGILSKGLVLHTIKVLNAIGQRIIFGWSKDAYQEGTRHIEDEQPSTSPKLLIKGVEAIRKVFMENNAIDNLTDEALIKICRQLDFWYQTEQKKYSSNDDDEEALAASMTKLTKHLIEQSLWFHDHLTSSSSNDDNLVVKVPTSRFGKTELQMPFITCGGMRLQNTWLPDSVPVLRPSRSYVLQSPPQKNIKDCIRSCLKLGINHFETARMYGTSEYQMVEALYELIQEGEIKREDFILQTKIVPARTEAFRKAWKYTWDNIKDKLGYIDLFGLHVISHLNDEVKETYAICQELKKEGKLRHIGFSTHGTAKQIMTLLNTEMFEYVNLHYHYFGSYHATGTDDTLGGEGNYECIKRARELDMGVFQISPVDKGGKLFVPSKDCATLIGKDLTPIGFALLYAWKNGIHTSSVGIGRSSDLDEAMGAIRLLNLEKEGKVNVDEILNEAVSRLQSRAEEKMGKEWAEKGLLGLPTCYDESTDGVSVSQMLWLHNLLSSYGMYDFCYDRYIGLLLASKQWDKKKSFQENTKKIGDGNPGRSFDESVNYKEVLKNHYNPTLALQKLKELHMWLNDETKTKYSQEELENMNWDKAYNLTCWEIMPGDIDSRDGGKLMIHLLTGGRMGLETGPTSSFRAEAKQLRDALKKNTM